MSRHKAAQNCSILPWLSERADGKEGRFIQVGNSLLLSKAFQDLPSGAQMLFLCMALESGGKRSFLFPLSAATKKYGFSGSTFRRYVDALVDAGFVVRHSMANLRQPNEYEFSLAWKARPP